MAQGYKFALDPGPSQAAKFASFNGGRRTARNTMLGLIKANLGQREAEKSYGIADLTPGMSWSAFSLRKQWNQIKGEVAPWWAENSKEVYASGLADLADALHNWSESKKGTRKGPRMGFPRFEKKRDGRAHFTFTTGAIRVEPDRHHVVLPCLGRIKTHESTRKLARRLENGSARILKATVTQQHGRWFVSFNCLVERSCAIPRPAASVVGIDLGVRDLIVVARPDGTEVERSRHRPTCGTRCAGYVP